MGTIASQITSLTIVYSTVYSDADQRKHQSSASLAFVRGIHRGPVNSPHKWPVTRKMFPFHDVIMHDTQKNIFYANLVKRSIAAPYNSVSWTFCHSVVVLVCIRAILAKTYAALNHDAWQLNRIIHEDGWCTSHIRLFEQSQSLTNGDTLVKNAIIVVVW